ncbi:hypothetical protein K440DRAFT_639420 [Wilcoxina mikolae CBS 423.85]|nr:hypothetical protein K440DRAFT_639420 [Wilcoxina mikolae CBS 423.85]
MTEASDPNEMTVTVNSKEYTVNTITFSYFSSNTSSNHQIEQFDVALRCVYESFHIAFEVYKSEFANYATLCQTLQRLGVNVLGDRPLSDILSRIKFFQLNGEEELKMCTNLAEDWIFKLLYMHHSGQMAGRGRTNVVFNTITYILSHSYWYNPYTRNVVREIYKSMNPVEAVTSGGGENSYNLYIRI